MSLTPGTRFGAFEVQSRLGAGGMGEVFLAHDTRLGRAVALKVLPAALAALNHPGIAAIYDTVEISPRRARSPTRSTPLTIRALSIGTSSPPTSRSLPRRGTK